MDKRAGRACFVVLLSLALAAPGLAQRLDVLSPAYEAVVRLYVSGDREGAVAEMCSWPASRVREEVRAFDAVWQKAHACPDCGAPKSSFEMVEV